MRSSERTPEELRGLRHGCWVMVQRSFQNSHDTSPDLTKLCIVLNGVRLFGSPEENREAEKFLGHELSNTKEQVKVKDVRRACQGQELQLSSQQMR